MCATADFHISGIKPMCSVTIVLADPRIANIQLFKYSPLGVSYNFKKPTHCERTHAVDTRMRFNPLKPKLV
jgi:hypothetical protein